MPKYPSVVANNGKAESKVKVPKAKKSAPTTPLADRPKPVHPELRAEFFLGKNAVGAPWWKLVLGWEEESEDKPFGADYLLLDMNGKKIRCTKNLRNRPTIPRNYKSLAKQILEENWADSRNGEPDPITGDKPTINGETVVIGRYDNVVSGQHRGIGCILGHQMWEKADPSHKWRKRWHDGPTVELLVVYGVDESQRTTRTVDTGKPRSFGDVLFADGKFSGAKLSVNDRKVLVRTAEHAVRGLWKRVANRDDAFDPRRTHAEAMDFLNLHPKLEEAVLHLWTEQQGDSIRRYFPLGTASAVLYLMGASGPQTTREDYLLDPREQRIDWSLWNRACEFWALLSSDAVVMKPVRDALKRLGSADGLAQATNDEKEVVLIKAWNIFKLGHKSACKITVDDVMPEYSSPDSDGYKSLKNIPVIGGIDAGNAALLEPAEPTTPTLELYTAPDNQLEDQEPEEEEDSPEEDDSDDIQEEDSLEKEEDGPGPGDPTPSEIAERAQAVIRAREEKEKAEYARSRKPVRRK